MSGTREPRDFIYSSLGEAKSVFLTGDGADAMYRCFELYDGTRAVEVATQDENYLFMEDNGRIVVHTGDGFYNGSFPDVLSEGFKQESGIDGEQVKALLSDENSFEPINDGLPEP